MRCKCLKYVREGEREREEGVVRCDCLKYIYIYIQRERERYAVSARNMLDKEGEGARGGCGALPLLEVYIYIYTARDRERCAVSARNMLERARGGVWSFVKCLECIEGERDAL